MRVLRGMKEEREGWEKERGKEVEKEER